MLATRFKINGCPVKIDDNGLFVVTMATGERLMAQSLAALNRAAAKTARFDAFPVLNYSRYGFNPKTPAFEPATVVGFAGNRYGWVNRYKLADNTSRDIVTLDTPENRATLKKMHALRKRERALERKIGELADTLATRRPRDSVTQS